MNPSPYVTEEPIGRTLVEGLPADLPGSKNPIANPCLPVIGYPP